MSMVDIDGGQLRYEITGDGPPLVLALPQSTGPAGRRALIDGLARGHTVVTYEPRGIGGSSPAVGSVSMAAQAADVLGLLDALGLDRVSLVCHSTGCGIGLSVAADHPQRLRALVLAAPWTYADAHLTTMQNLRKAAARTLDPWQYARFNAALLFPPEFRRADEVGFDRLAAETAAQPQDADEITRRLDAILAFDARPLLPAIRCATLVTVAKDDQLMPVWFAAEAARAIADAEFLEFDTGGHMLPETRGADFVAVVSAFLARIDLD
jgi:pimeloyl-ACP methyl ester carboxylesterase